MSDSVTNELLCYVQNNLSAFPRELVGVAICGFFTDDEVSVAKSVMHAIVDDKIKANEMDDNPHLRYKKRRDSDNRRKLECNDILDLFEACDSNMIRMPTFVAANLKRLPKVVPGDVDVYQMGASVVSLEGQVDTLTKKLETLCSTNDKAFKLIQEYESKLEALSASNEKAIKLIQDYEAILRSKVGSSTMEVPVSAAGNVESVNVNECVNKTSQKSWAGVVSGPVAAFSPSVTALPTPLTKATVVKSIRLKGTATQANIKAVPRKPPRNLVKAFVGRMDIDTTEDDLSQFLRGKGLDVVHCRKLKPPGDKTFSTAAFYVACTEECSDIFYNDGIWPEGAELRDWYSS